MSTVTNLNSVYPEPDWMRWTLFLAALYNIAWGGFIVLFPNKLFELSGLAIPRYPEIWQCVGMIVGVYGIGYLIAATQPYRHWPIVLVGLLGKLFGPIGFLQALNNGVFNTYFGTVIVTNDLIWWIPFTLILTRTYQYWRTSSTISESFFAEAH